MPENAELLRADAILVVDTGNFAVGVPTLTTTLRGMTSVDVTVRGLASAMHSGMFGGPAPDALVAPDPDARARCTTRTATRPSTGSTQRSDGRCRVPAEQFRATRRCSTGSG